MVGAAKAEKEESDVARIFAEPDAGMCVGATAKKPPEGGSLSLHLMLRQAPCGPRDTNAHQAAATPMPLNSPEAMRFCHSAGPVMWALVPPASTATVTGMSTTSNS